MSIDGLENKGDLQRFIEKVVATPGVLPPTPASGGGGSYYAGSGITLTGGDTFNADFGTGAGKVTEGNDSRLSDARTPTAHKTSHESGGTDALTLAQSQVTGLTTDLSNKQPFDTDLTNIAAVPGQTSFGQGLLSVANGAALLTVAGGAPLVSPILSGDPEAPTATAGDNDTSIATTAFVKTANDNASTADRARANHTGTQAQSTVVNLVSDLALKAPLAGPTFTGSVKVPGASIGTEAINLSQLDSAIAAVEVGATFKPACDRVTYDAATFPAHTRSGDVLTMNSYGFVWTDDGLAAQFGDRVLIANASPASHNGIYRVTVSPNPSSYGKFTRGPDAVDGILANGAYVTVKLGGPGQDSRDFILTTPDPIVVNTTSQTWEPIAPRYLPARGVFRAYASSHATIAPSSDVLFAANAEDFDPDGWHDPTTNKGRYTPQKPGYYRFSGGISFSTTLAAARYGLCFLFKNGTKVSQLGQTPAAAAAAFMGGTDTFYMNGSSDYMELYMRHNHTANITLSTGSTAGYFSGEFIGS